MLTFKRFVHLCQARAAFKYTLVCMQGWAQIVHYFNDSFFTYVLQLTPSYNLCYLRNIF